MCEQTQGKGASGKREGESRLCSYHWAGNTGLCPSSALLALTILHASPLLNLPPCLPRSQRLTRLGEHKGQLHQTEPRPFPRTPGSNSGHGGNRAKSQASPAPIPGYPGLTASPGGAASRIQQGEYRAPGPRPRVGSGTHTNHSPLYLHRHKPGLHSGGLGRPFRPPPLASVCQHQLLCRRLLTPFCTT